MRRSYSIGILLCFALSAYGQSLDGVDTLKMQQINEVTVTERYMTIREWEVNA